jgi:hypothetical protein
MAIIQNEDWNPVQSKLVRVLSTPDGTTNDLGYNTSYGSGQVADNATVTGAQWNALRTDINKAYLLQTGSNSDLTTRDSTAKITQADLTAISARVDTAFSNKGAVSTGQLNYIAGPSYSLSFTWYGGFTAIDATITWANNAAFRGFWNGGGRIVITGSRSGGSATSQNQSWTNLMNNMGSIVLTRTSMFQSGNSWTGTFLNSWGSGMYGPAGIQPGVVRAFTISSQDTNYTANSFEIRLAGNSSDIKTMTSLRILTDWNDGHQPQGSNTPSEVGGGGPTGFGPDYVDGTMSNSCAIYYPFSETRPNNY